MTNPVSEVSAVEQTLDIQSLVDKVNAVDLKTNTKTCEAGTEVIHPIFIPILIITSYLS
jgi:hypothetical protein